MLGQTGLTGTGLVGIVDGGSTPPAATVYWGWQNNSDMIRKASAVAALTAVIAFVPLPQARAASPQPDWTPVFRKAKPIPDAFAIGYPSIAIVSGWNVFQTDQGRKKAILLGDTAFVAVAQPLVLGFQSQIEAKTTKRQIIADWQVVPAYPFAQPQGWNYPHEIIRKSRRLITEQVFAPFAEARADGWNLPFGTVSKAKPARIDAQAITPFAETRVDGWQSVFERPVRRQSIRVDQLAVISVQQPTQFGWFGTIEGLQTRKSPVALFDWKPVIASQITPDTHDGGVFVKKKRKKYAHDAVDEDFRKRKRLRADLELAIYGPPVEITGSLYDPLVGVVPNPIYDVELIKAVLKAAEFQAQKAAEEEQAEEEEALGIILGEI